MNLIPILHTTIIIIFQEISEDIGKKKALVQANIGRLLSCHVLFLFVFLSCFCLYFFTVPLSFFSWEGRAISRKWNYMEWRFINSIFLVIWHCSNKLFHSLNILSPLNRFKTSWTYSIIDLVLLDTRYWYKNNYSLCVGSANIYWLVWSRVFGQYCTEPGFYALSQTISSRLISKRRLVADGSLCSNVLFRKKTTWDVSYLHAALQLILTLNFFKDIL